MFAPMWPILKSASVGMKEALGRGGAAAPKAAQRSVVRSSGTNSRGNRELLGMLHRRSADHGEIRDFISHEKVYFYVSSHKM